MYIEAFSVKNLRNLLEIKAGFNSKFNFIIGKNGAGKTSLLEALFFLSTGRSFRTAKLAQLMTQQQRELILFARIRLEQPSRLLTVGVAKCLSEPMQIKLNGEGLSSFVPLAQLLPMQVLAPDAVNLIEDEADSRRRFVDWGVFHVEPQFVAYWRRLRQVVQQRNALLKQPRSDAQLVGWTALLVQLSMHIQQLRHQYVTGFVEYLKILLGEDAEYFQVQLEQGWPVDQALDTCLVKGLEQDKRMGFTRYGAHRADLKLLYNGQPAKQILSRGQKKLFNARLLIAQLEHLFGDHARHSICLLDDLSAELDEENRYKIYQSLDNLQSQVFITGVQLDPVIANKEFSLKMFHVERGALIETSHPTIE